MDGASPHPLPSGKSADVEALEELEKELWREVRSKETELYKLEVRYIQDSTSPPESVPSIGNLISGWETILEGKGPDKKKGSERIYSDSSMTWQNYRLAQERRRMAQTNEAA